MGNFATDWWRNKKNVITHLIYFMQVINIGLTFSVFFAAGKTSGSSAIGRSLQFVAIWLWMMNVGVGVLGVMIVNKYRQTFHCGIFFGMMGSMAAIMLALSVLFGGLASFISAVGSTNDTRHSYNSVAAFSAILFVLYCLLCYVTYRWYEAIIPKQSYRDDRGAVVTASAPPMNAQQKKEADMRAKRAMQSMKQRRPTEVVNPVAQNDTKTGAGVKGTMTV